MLFWVFWRLLRVFSLFFSLSSSSYFSLQKSHQENPNLLVEKLKWRWWIFSIIGVVDRSQETGLIWVCQSFFKPLFIHQNQGKHVCNQFWWLRNIDLVYIFQKKFFRAFIRNRLQNGRATANFHMMFAFSGTIVSPFRAPKGPYLADVAPCERRDRFGLPRTFQFRFDIFLPPFHQRVFRES